MTRPTYDELVALGLEPQRAEWLAGADIVNEPSQEALDAVWGVFEAAAVARSKEAAA